MRQLSQQILDASQAQEAPEVRVQGEKGVQVRALQLQGQMEVPRQPTHCEDSSEGGGEQETRAAINYQFFVNRFLFLVFFFLRGIGSRLSPRIFFCLFC